VGWPERGSIVAVLNLLLALLTLAVVAGVAALLAGFVTGGGLDDAPSTIPERRLPEGPITGRDVERLRFVPALRGYRMDQVDAAMDRLGQEIDRLRAELDQAEQPAEQDGGALPQPGEYGPP
jgi:DivIVA domain-containing protein